MGWTVLETRLLAPLLHPAREGAVCEGLALIGDKEGQITRWTSGESFAQCWERGISTRTGELFRFLWVVITIQSAPSKRWRCCRPTRTEVPLVS